MNYLPPVKVPLPECKKVTWIPHSHQVKWYLALRRHLVKFVEWINKQLYLESLGTCVYKMRNLLLYKESGHWLINNELASHFWLYLPNFKETCVYLCCRLFPHTYVTKVILSLEQDLGEWGTYTFLPHTFLYLHFFMMSVCYLSNYKNSMCDHHPPGSNVLSV